MYQIDMVVENSGGGKVGQGRNIIGIEFSGRQNSREQKWFK
jgi:hypothetical protein